MNVLGARRVRRTVDDIVNGMRSRLTGLRIGGIRVANGGYRMRSGVVGVGTIRAAEVFFQSHLISNFESFAKGQDYFKSLVLRRKKLRIIFRLKFDLE